MRGLLSNARPRHAPGRTGRESRARALLTQLLRRHRRHFALALVGGLLDVVAMVTAPLLVGAGVERLRPGAGPSGLHALLALLVGLGVLRACGTALRKWQTVKLQSTVAADVRSRLYQHAQRLSFTYHDRVGPGDLLARIAGDTWLLQTFVALLPFVALSAALGVAAGALLFTVQPLLAMGIVAVVSITAWAAASVSMRMQSVARAVQDRLGTYSRFVEQQVRGIRVVKGHGFAAVGAARGTALADGVHVAASGLFGLNARFWSTFLFAPAGATMLVVGFGGWLGVRGDLRPGDIVTFLLYLALLMAPVTVAAQLGSTWPVCAAAAARIVDVLDAVPDVADPPHPRALPPGLGEIRFEGIVFGYRQGRPVLDGIDLHVEAGTSVALVGMSGAGKTTLTQLVPRFYDPWQGEVLLDGVPIRELRLADLRRCIGVVFQDTVVFSCSVRDNIAFAKPDATDAEIREAAQRAHCDTFVRALPEGYDTLVGESGASLSGGQRQRLAIARAILSDSRVLIHDDATSAVDPGSDAAVRAGLLEVMKGRTTLLVAHRVETLALADRVLFFEQGRIVADGTHEELLALPGYRRALALPAEVPA